MFLLLALFGVYFADEIHSSFYEWENKKVVEKINDLKKYQMFDDDGKSLFRLNQGSPDSFSKIILGPHICRVKTKSETSWAKVGFLTLKIQEISLLFLQLNS